MSEATLLLTKTTNISSTEGTADLYKKAAKVARVVIVPEVKAAARVEAKVVARVEARAVARVVARVAARAEAKVVAKVAAKVAARAEAKVAARAAHLLPVHHLHHL